MKKVLISFLFILSIITSGCTLFFEKNDPEVENKVYSVNDLDHLKTLLSGAKEKFFQYRSTADTIMMEPSSTTNQENTTSSSENSHSNTNVQVEGVDEGDIVKNDNNRIYSINYNQLRVVEIDQMGHMTLLKNEVIKNDFYSAYSEIYLSEKYFIAIGHEYSYVYPMIGAQIDNKEVSIMPSIRYSPTTTVYFYDIETLELSKKFSISGYNLGSRMINNNLYIMSNHYVYWDDTIKDPRPIIIEDNVSSSVEFGDIQYFPGVENSSFTIISGFVLDEVIDINNSVFLGNNGWGQIYVSQNNMYFATTSYQFFENKSIQNGRVISYNMNHEDGSVTFSGVGSFNGNILNQFSLDEYNGFLRMVTTEGWIGEGVINRLYIFKKDYDGLTPYLKNISLIDKGIGKVGETIRSVLFNQNFVSVVTYVQTDPLYLIDLTDPYNPFIKGQLEISGYSTYQHYWSEDILFTLGYEAEGNLIKGIKLALYDVSGDNPVEIGKPLVFMFDQNSWIYGEALYNHKAMLIANQFNFIGLSLWSSHFNEGNYYSTSDYYLFEINPISEESISIKKIFSHFDLSLPIGIDDNESYYGYYDYSIQRAIYINNFLFVISNNAITSHDLNGDLSTLQTLIYNTIN